MSAIKRILLVLSDDETAQLIERNILLPEEHQSVVARNCEEAQRLVNHIRPDLMILGDELPDGNFIDLANSLLAKQPTLPIILFSSEAVTEFSRELFQLGLVDWLNPPLNIQKMQASIARGLQRSEDWQKWLRREASRHTGTLKQQVSELEALSKAGRAVASKLELDDVLTTVVDSAVDLTGADGGSILLLDDDSGELFMYAARNFQDDFVQTFRLKTDDSIAGEVVRTGEPVILNSPSPQKIKTSYLVHSLIYVPMVFEDRVIGVLGVDNRQTNQPFEERHVTLLAAMADYAVIALDNAQLYSQTEQERNKLAQILTQVEDGVVVYDLDEKIVLLNHTVNRAFALKMDDYFGKPLAEVFTRAEALEALRREAFDPQRIELEGEDGRTYNVRVTRVPEIGTIATMHDISYFKELDSLKTDFVNTVSHDLRSPLTSILGYVELIGRVGEVTDDQKEFIKRVQISVKSITALIDDLLNLGRIEVGIAEDIKEVPLNSILNYSLEGLRNQIEARKQKITTQIEENIPAVYGNPIQLRQMMDNLIGNALKYTPVGGEIAVKAMVEDGQAIIQVLDNGLGIPSEEQYRIFEKFYRAKNVQAEVPGTGLGLAITKSIVDNHRGRIWVDSILDQGSTFTVVLPVGE